MKQEGNRLVVAPGGWHESLPEWLLDEIKTERIMSGFANLLGKGEIVGDAEICAYLFTTSLSAPMPHNYNEIYIYLTAKVMTRSPDGKIIITDFMREKLDQGLTIDEERDLKRLREDIYRKRGGEIRSPLFDVLKDLKKKHSCSKQEA